MKPLKEWEFSTDPLFGTKRVWAFDLDDTLTEDGSLPAKIVETLEYLQKSGHYTIIVSGRPASWGLPFAKLLPLDAVIVENGSTIFYWPNGKGSKKLHTEPKALFWSPKGYVSTEEFMTSPAKSMSEDKKYIVVQEIREKFPRVKLASDQLFRLYDLAVDFAEAIDPPLSIDEAVEIKDIFETHGATAKVSSIHVNGWWGDFDKSSGVQELFENVEWSMGFDKMIYFGDSPNDAPLFTFSPMSVGVSNLNDFQSDTSWTRPKFITANKSSSGVIEAVSHYLNS